MQLAFLETEGSPIRRQYLALKRQYPEAILFFQLGDFYETFEDDARIVAEVCDVALTSREMGRGERLPMAGVPVHAGETYIGRLVERGYHIALCQQMEPASAAASRGSATLVRREVTRVITPGTLVDPALLAPTRANYLAAVIDEGRRTGLAYADISTGEFACAEVDSAAQQETARAELWRLEASECLVADEPAARNLLPPSTTVTTDATLFSDAEATLRAHFGVASIAALGLGEAPLAARAAAAILRYVARTQPPATGILDHLRLYDPLGHMVLDPTTRDHLELLRTGRGRKEGSLLQALDRTHTAMGGRLLAQWLGHPLLDRRAIDGRLDVVDALLADGSRLLAIGARLAETPDLERLVGRLAQRLLSPREALALAQAVECAEALGLALDQSADPALSAYGERLAVPTELAREIRETISEDPPPFGEGVIRRGREPDLDELHTSSSDGRQWLLDLERRERERTGVKGLKVGYNRVFGYYVEVSAAALGQPLDYYRRQEAGIETTAQLLEQLGYQRRQTVANAERFALAELRDYETRQDRSRARMAELERQIFDRLIARAAAHGPRLAAAARALAEIDVLACFAEVAREHRYVRPELVDEPSTEIFAGRHPVVERALPWGGYIPNDTALAHDGETGAPCLMVLTGPNMAGKTTYGRMVLVLCLMAQCGSFVPAERARLGMVDRLFLRSGAGDDITGGQSTFMMEMTETAAILRAATSRSLAFFDEVGRGTSTYDGMALARAIVEFLATDPDHGCRTLFSTHYHELAALEDLFPCVQSHRTEVVEAADRVSFTYRVVRGRADRSYGVHVARLAGLPPSVTGRAEDLLSEWERQPPPSSGPEPAKRTRRTGHVPASPELQHAVQDLAEADVDHMTPLEALNTLARLRAAAREARER